MSQNYILPGSSISYEGSIYRVKSILDPRRILAERPEDDHIAVLPIASVTPVNQSELKRPDINLVPDESWAVATQRYLIIKPILANRSDGKLVKEIAKREKVAVTTLYRWVDHYEATGLVSSLLNYNRDGGRGKARVPLDVDAIIQEAIQEEYLTSQRKPLSKVYQRVSSQCRQAGLTIPHINTVRNRIIQLTEYARLKFRYGKRVADEQLAPLRGHFPNADFPMAVVQIDHTKLDIVLVMIPVSKRSGVPGLQWLSMYLAEWSRGFTYRLIRLVLW